MTLQMALTSSSHLQMSHSKVALEGLFHDSIIFLLISLVCKMALWLSSIRLFFFPSLFLLSSPYQNINVSFNLFFFYYYLFYFYLFLIDFFFNFPLAI
jgi:hypothetical protein